MPNSDPAAIQKLPFWATIQKSYAALFENFADILKTFWPWGLVIAVLGFAFSWFTWPILGPIFAKISSGQSADISMRESLTMGVAGLLNHVLFVPILASLAVAWHRLILRSEKVTSPLYLRLDKTVWLYAMVVIALSFLQQLPSFLNTAVLSIAESERSALFMTPLTLLLVVLSFIIWARLSVYLPVVALEHRDISVRNVWDRTKKNTLRLIFGPIICVLPIMALSFALIYVMGNDQLSLAIRTAVSTVLFVLMAFPAVCFLSLAYQHFFEGKQVSTHESLESTS